MFKKAVRESAKLRLALTGPAGSGKTYSSLQIAKGLGGKIAMIDTERGSGALYANICDYDVLRIDPPFEPKKFLEGIKAAEDAGYDVLIIDSLSHAWAGDGGILTIHDRTAKATRNSFDAWREVTPQHNQLVDAILASTCHVIVTLRTKTGYEVSSENGKTKVSKIGLAPVQRDGLEYEFTCVLDLSIDGHTATTSKDRTGILDGKRFTPQERTGKMLLEWIEDKVPSLIQDGGSTMEDSRVSASIGYLDQMLDQLGLLEHRVEYRDYVLSRYTIGSIEDLSEESFKEQSALLRQCLERREKRLEFIEILKSGRKAA
jgi:hypothetical protein